MIQKYIKFIGNYGDLKKMGYKFYRLFASNYMCWSKYTDPEGYGDHINIWKKGNCVEFNDIFSLSHLVLQSILDGKTGEWNAFGHIYCEWMIDIENKTITEYDPDKHNEFLMAKADGVKFYENGIPIQSEWNEWYKNYYKKWRRFNVDPIFIDLVRELVNKHMIEISERNVDRR